MSRYTYEVILCIDRYLLRTSTFLVPKRQEYTNNRLCTATGRLWGYRYVTTTSPWHNEPQRKNYQSSAHWSEGKKLPGWDKHERAGQTKVEEKADYEGNRQRRGTKMTRLQGCYTFWHSTCVKIMRVDVSGNTVWAEKSNRKKQVERLREDCGHCWI